MAWPEEIKFVSTDRRLEIRYDDGTRRYASAFHLRMNSPSAEVQGHGGKKLSAPVGKEAVTIVRMEQVGNYAVRLIFDDGHDSGLFTWNALCDLTQEMPARDQ